MVYTIFDTQVAKDHIGETVVFGSCISDFQNYNRIGILTKVHDEPFIKEPYEDLHGNVFPIVITVSLSQKLLNIVSTLSLEEREQLGRFLRDDLYST